MDQNDRQIMRKLREQGMRNADYSKPTSDLSEEQQAIRDQAQEFRKKYGTEDQINHEAPAQEQGYGEAVEDFLTQGKENLPPGTFRSSLPVSRMEFAGEKLAEKPSSALMGEAIRKPKLLQKMAEQGVPAAEAEVQAGKKAVRAAYQESQDIRKGIKSPGLGKDAKPFEGDYVGELKKARGEEIDAMRRGENDLSNAYKKADTAETTKALTYSDPKNARVALKRERMGLDMSRPDQRARAAEIDQELSDLVNSSVQATP